MYLIVGLGNPGNEYEKTRHNIGFDAISTISSKYNIDVNKTKFKGEYGKGTIAGENVILLKPLTFMNLSGESIREVMNFYKIPSENIIVIYDDISLEVGTLRIRRKGSAGGHNGIKDIIKNLSTDVFPRIKVGVGQPQGDLVSHVLGKFSKEDREIINKIFDVCSNVVESIIKDGLDVSMNKFNNFKVN